MKSKKITLFKFKPFSKKQRKVLNWWCNNSPVKDKDGIIADGAIRSGKTVSMSLSYVLWAKNKDGRWIATKEYYYSGRDEDNQKTDTEYADDLQEWLGKIKSEKIVVDPSAASFIAELKKRGHTIKKAKNDVLDGIRLVASLLNEDKIAIHESCTNTILEFNSYTWDAKVSEKGEDKPIKQHDHAMDAVRYFCYTIIRKPNGISILK